MKPIILSDVDGVVADWDLFFQQTMQEVCGKSEESQLTKEEKRAVWDLILKPGRIRTHMPELPYAVETIKSLSKFCNVYFITKPIYTKTWDYDRRNWLKDKFGDDFTNIQDVQFMAHKWLTYGDIFIDDRADNINPWVEHHPKGYGIIWDTNLQKSKEGWNYVLNLAKTISKKAL